MKSFLEIVACCGSGCSGSEAPRQPPEDSRLLVVPEPGNRVGRKRARVSGERRPGSVDWQPSLSSIAEDNVLMERKNAPLPAPPRSVKRRGDASVPQRRRADFSPHIDARRASVPAVTLPTFSPTPFLFL